MFFVTTEDPLGFDEPGLVEKSELTVTWYRPPTKPASQENERSTTRDALSCA
jgi:hypothetical protein